MEVCPKLQKLNLLDKTGESKTVHQCTEQSAPAFGTIIERTACDDCPVRGAVTLREKRGAPPKPEKVKRKPVSQPPKTDLDCLDMSQVLRVRCCGEVIRTNYCKSMTSQFYGTVVTPKECNDCPVRRVASK
jgi:hypothetical protein